MKINYHNLDQIGMLGDLGTIGGVGGDGDGAPAKYSVYAVTMNGVADYFSRASNLLNMPSSTSKFSAFTWVNHRFFDANIQLYLSSSSAYNFFGRYDSTSSNAVAVKLIDDMGGGGSSLQLLGSIPINSTKGWTLVGVSVDITNMAAPVYQILVNNTLDASITVFNGLLSNKIQLTGFTSWCVGAGPGGVFPFGGDMAIMWANFGTFLDFSDLNVRRKIITAAGKPVDPGALGASVTGSRPQVYMVQSSNVFSDPLDFAFNQGNGGAFATNGSPVIAPTSPSM